MPADDVPIAHALLVGDPGGDLPHARAEIARVGGSLQDREPAVAIERMVGDTVTASALHDALADTGLFHYAGHTIDRRGNDAPSGLALAGGRRFDLGDILTLERAPRVAVLSTCSGGAGSVDTAGETLSVAHAFLVRGSREVVATTRPVGDREAAVLIDALYRGWAVGRATDAALADAQRELASAIPDADWAAFRLYTR
jgi:CHAT domain-containing protein